MSRGKSQRRRTGLLGLALALAATSASGCRNRKRALAPVSFDPVQAAQLDEADRHAAPVWPRVERQILANGLLVHVLHEAEAVDLELRILFPTAPKANKLAALPTAVAALATRDEIKRRLRGLKVAVVMDSGPGRIELRIRASQSDAATVLSRVALGLARAPNARRVGILLQAETARLRQLDADTLASSYVVARLLDLPIEHLLPREAGADPAAVERAWKLFSDPRDAVLIVHGAETLDALSGPLDEMAERWKASSPRLRAPVETSLERLRREVEAPRKGHILDAPSARLWVLEGAAKSAKGGGQLVLGRVIDTSTPEARARARLAQRLLQQKVDARLVIHGANGTLLISHRLSSKDPLTSIKRLVDEVESLSKEPIQPERLTQAARLWLGARVVSASLDGEDWTGLWAEAIDLSLDDESIGLALGRDAAAMLETTSAELQEFARTWVRPRHDEGGWVWALAGADPEIRAALDAALPLEDISFD